MVPQLPPSVRLAAGYAVARSQSGDGHRAGSRRGRIKRKGGIVAVAPWPRRGCGALRVHCRGGRYGRFRRVWLAEGSRAIARRSMKSQRTP
jgi:hypothetical protein